MTNWSSCLVSAAQQANDIDLSHRRELMWDRIFGLFMANNKYKIWNGSSRSYLLTKLILAALKIKHIYKLVQNLILSVS